MKELIDPQTVERVMVFVAVAGPLLGFIVGAMVGAHSRNAVPSIGAGVLIGALGSLAYGLWKAYNAIANALGMDTVANLALQLALFAVLGAVLGVVIYRVTVLYRKLRAQR